MKPVPFRSALAPSPLVLRFLRAQADSAFGVAAPACLGLRDQSCSHASSATAQEATWPRGNIQKAGELGKATQERRKWVSASPRSNRDLPLHAPHRSTTNCALSAAFLPRSTNTQSRTFSTMNANWRSWSIWHRLNARKQRKPMPEYAKTSPLANMYDSTSNNHGSNTALGRIARPHELKLRCTELDLNGKIKMGSEEFKKTELIAKVWGTPTHNCDICLPDGTLSSS